MKRVIPIALVYATPTEAAPLLAALDAVPAGPGAPDRARGSRQAWPPSEWLDDEGWTSPTIKDDEGGSIVSAYGLTSTPTYVVLGPNNENLGRLAGEIGVPGLEALAQLAEGSLEG